MKLRPETVLPNAGEQANQTSQLRAVLAGLTGELSDIESRVANLIDQIERTANASLRSRYEQRATALEAKKVELTAEQAKKETALRELERGAQDFAAWQKNLAGMKKAISVDIESRIRLKAHLKEFISKVEVFAKGHEDNVQHALALVEEFLPGVEQAESFPLFKRYLRQRLLSPEGRFFKLFLKTAKSNSNGIPLAPVDSLAWHAEIKGKEMRFTGPDIAQLANEFFDARKPGFVPKASILGAA